jgi:hypothetical protein
MNDSLDMVEDLEDNPKKTSLAYDDETVLWEGRPSQWVNLGTFIFWSFVAIVSLIFISVWKGVMNAGYSDLINTIVLGTSWMVVVISMLSIAIPYLSTKFERTVITNNKIKESKGITKLFQVDRFAEISDIRDLNSPAAGLLAIWGLSTLIIETNDEDQPIIKIRAIRDRDELIAKLLPIWRELKIERKGYFGDR